MIEVKSLWAVAEISSGEWLDCGGQFLDEYLSNDEATYGCL
jgi:hypothetical protein